MSLASESVLSVRPSVSRIGFRRRAFHMGAMYKRHPYHDSGILTLSTTETGDAKDAAALMKPADEDVLQRWPGSGDRVSAMRRSVAAATRDA
jgi:hypothetical protein